MLCELAWIFEYSYVIWLIWKLHIHERSWETWNVCNRCWLISFVDPLYKLCLIGHTFPIGFHFSLNFEANVSLITVVIYRIGESKISIILDSQRVHVLFLWYLVLSKSCHQSYINPVQSFAASFAAICLCVGRLPIVWFRVQTLTIGETFGLVLTRTYRYTLCGTWTFVALIGWRKAC